MKQVAKRSELSGNIFASKSLWHSIEHQKMGRNNLVVGLVVVMVVVGLKFFAAVQGLIADLHRWAPHSESNFQSSLISDAHVEALRELDPIIVPTAHRSLCVDHGTLF